MFYKIFLRNKKELTFVSSEMVVRVSFNKNMDFCKAIYLYIVVDFYYIIPKANEVIEKPCGV